MNARTVSTAALTVIMFAMLALPSCRHTTPAAPVTVTSVKPAPAPSPVPFTGQLPTYP